MSSPTQLLNALGWLTYRLNFMQTMSSYALNQDTPPQQADDANNQVLIALDEVQTVLNALYQKLGREQPLSATSDQELSDMSII